MAASTHAENVAHNSERIYVVIEAPSNLGLQPVRSDVPPGVRRLSVAMEAAGFSKRVGAEHAGRVEPPPYTGCIDAGTGIRDAPAIRDYSIRLAEAVGKVLDSGRFPLVLGGDCSILLGNLLALRVRGRYGLFFLDAHPDFATPETSASKAAAGMDLALATGYGPSALAMLDPRGPLVLEEDVVLLGARGLDDEWRQRLACTRMTLHDLDTLRRDGVASLIRIELGRLAGQGVEGFWIHLDADVLDDAVMPAVDSRQPGGLSLSELTSALREPLESPLFVGTHIGIYDPDLDPGGVAGKALTSAVVAAFPDPGGKKIGRMPTLSLGTVAEIYVKLALSLGLHDVHYVDAYIGPPEWRDEAEPERGYLPDLRAAAESAVAALRGIDPPQASWIACGTSTWSD